MPYENVRSNKNTVYKKLDGNVKSWKRFVLPMSNLHFLSEIAKGKAIPVTGYGGP
jgi:hypothetical protein